MEDPCRGPNKLESGNSNCSIPNSESPEGPELAAKLNQILGMMGVKLLKGGRGCLVQRVKFPRKNLYSKGGLFHLERAHKVPRVLHPLPLPSCSFVPAWASRQVSLPRDKEVCPASTFV